MAPSPTHPVSVGNGTEPLHVLVQGMRWLQQEYEDKLNARDAELK